MIDSVSDMLTRIRNAYSSKHTETSVPYSKMKVELAKLLSRHGFVGEVTVDKEKRSFTVGLLYVDGSPTLLSVRRISKPGLRIYKKATSLRPVRSGLGMFIVSTSKGLMSGGEARKKKLGGEVVAEVY